MAKLGKQNSPSVNFGQQFNNAVSNIKQNLTAGVSSSSFQFNTINPGETIIGLTNQLSTARKATATQISRAEAWENTASIYNTRYLESEKKNNVLKNEIDRLRATLSAEVNTNRITEEAAFAKIKEKNEIIAWQTRKNTDLKDEIRILNEELDHTTTTLKTVTEQRDNYLDKYHKTEAEYSDYKGSHQDWDERIKLSDEATRQTNERLTLQGPNLALVHLIDSGADAQQNLFEVDIAAGLNQTEFNDEKVPAKNLTFRINNFNAPEKQLQTQDLPYQSGSFPKVMPSSGISRNLDFTVRLDSNYQIYWFMNRIFPGDSQGNFDLNLYNNISGQVNPYLSRIQVKALKPNPKVVLTQSDDHHQTTGGYDIIYSWTFFDCILYKIPQVQLSQDTAGPVTGVYSFKFGYMQEGPGITGLEKSLNKETFFTLDTRDSLLNSNSLVINTSSGTFKTQPGLQVDLR